MQNVLLILSDEHNPFYTSIYGHPFIRTPNLDRLARMGTTFDAAYCPSPLCLPSRSAFMAGRRVHDLQTYNNSLAGLESADYPSFGKVLTDQGVHAHYIGKVDVYSPFEELGFTSGELIKDRTYPGDINVRRNPLRIRENAGLRAEKYGPHSEVCRPGDGDALKVDRGIEFLQRTAPTLDCPWLVVVAIGNPHFPHHTSQELWDMYPQGEDLPVFGPECESARHLRAVDLRDHFETDTFTEEQIRGQRRGYLGCVTYVDRQVGRLLDALEESGGLDSTTVIYASDHGEMLGTFGMWWKCSLYEDSVRIPIVAAGDGFASGARVKTPVDLLDVQASIFHALEADRPADWVGRPLQTIDPDDPGRFVFAEYHGHGVRGSSYLIRKGPWKLIYHVGAENQLFNLDDDPHELNNLYKAEPEKAAELAAHLREVCDPERENDRAEAFVEAQVAVVEGMSR
jgi:choline-sulfatase